MRPILLLLDGCATHLQSDVVGQCLRLNIQLFLLPPNTSHGLAACDQFNQRLHYLRTRHDVVLSSGGAMQLEVTMRLQALAMALEDLSQLHHEIVAAWRRAGITQERRSVDFLASQPRGDVLPPDGGGSAAAVGDSPAPTLTSQLATVEALQTRVTKLEAALAEATCATVALEAKQRGEVMGRLEYRAKQLREAHQRRTLVQRNGFGDVTKDDLLAAIVARRKRQQAAAAKASSQAAKTNWEEPLRKALLEAGVANIGAKLTKVNIADGLARLGQPTTGSRQVILERLAAAMDIDLGVADDPESASGESGAGEAEVVGDDEFEENVEADPEAQEEEGVDMADSEDAAALQEAMQAFLAANKPDLEEVEELLEACEESVKMCVKPRVENAWLARRQ